MTPRIRTAKAPGSSSRRHERLKDEIYRQMYRLEASRPGAELGLAIALLHAWIASDSDSEMPQTRQWLKKICPICLPMIEAMQRVSEAERQCIP
jgi:cell division FtsZ-interacting protein ZapD